MWKDLIMCRPFESTITEATVRSIAAGLLRIEHICERINTDIYCFTSPAWLNQFLVHETNFRQPDCYIAIAKQPLLFGWANSFHFIFLLCAEKANVLLMREDDILSMWWCEKFHQRSSFVRLLVVFLSLQQNTCHLKFKCNHIYCCTNSSVHNSLDYIFKRVDYEFSPLYKRTKCKIVTYYLCKIDLCMKLKMFLMANLSII